MERGVVGQHYEIPYFHPNISTHSLGMALTRTAWVWLDIWRAGA